MYLLTLFWFLFACFNVVDFRNISHLYINMQACSVGYRERWGKVSQFCAQAGQGVQEEKHHSWVTGGVGKWGLIPAFVQSLVCVPWIAVRNAKWALVSAQGCPGTQYCCCPLVPGDVRDWAAERDQWMWRDWGMSAVWAGAAPAALFLKHDFTGIHLVLLLEAPPVPEKSPCWAVLPLPWCQPGDTALQSRTLHWFLVFRANLTALLSWKWGFHCSLPSAGSGREKATFYGCYLHWRDSWNKPPSAGFSY